MKKKIILSASTSNLKKRQSNENQKTGYFLSDADVLSSALSKTPKRATPKRTPLSEKQIVSNNISEAMSRTVEKQRISGNKNEINFTDSNFTDSEYDNDHYYYEETKAQSPEPQTNIVSSLPVQMAHAPSLPAPIDRKQMSIALKEKVAFAINYQLLDILNNGSKDEVCYYITKKLTKKI